MNQESKRPVTLEDIIRLKRAERPPAEFWTTFDRELRAKQLAALVEKRPWWRTLNVSRAFGGFSRYYLSLGAAALLAVGYVVTRDSRTEVRPTHAATPMLATTERVAATASEASTAPALAESAPALVAVAENITTSPEANADVTSAEPNATLAADTSLLRSDTPSARYINANLRAAQEAESVVSRGLLTQASGFETRGVPAKPATVEPLAQMTSPNSARIAKLSSAMSSAMFASNKSTATSDRVAHRLLNESDDRLYESVSRIKARANSFDWKL